MASGDWVVAGFDSAALQAGTAGPLGAPGAAVPTCAVVGAGDWVEPA
jgi:hypothetical protein